jgi:hypothetical protein|tara:strand:+ start:421 stop:645 length:225 start_codon:yes stop_codon:yes gene_type:complete
LQSFGVQGAQRKKARSAKDGFRERCMLFPFSPLLSLGVGVGKKRKNHFQHTLQGAKIAALEHAQEHKNPNIIIF